MNKRKYIKGLVMSIFFLPLVATIIMAYINGKIQLGSKIKRLSKRNSRKAAIDIYELKPFILKSNALNLLFNGIFCFLLLFKGPALTFAWIVLSLMYGAAGLVFSLYLFKSHCNQPHLRDYSTIFANTSLEYMKLRSVLETSKQKHYLKMTKNLWDEIASINKRRHSAISRKSTLLNIEKDTSRLLVSYSNIGDEEKHERAKARLDKVYAELERIEEFNQNVIKQITDAQHLFVEIRTNISLDESEKIATDISSLTSRIKSLEYSVEVIDY